MSVCWNCRGVKQVALAAENSRKILDVIRTEHEFALSKKIPVGFFVF